MRTVVLTLLALGTALPLHAQTFTGDDFPDGWRARPDRAGADQTEVEFFTMGEGYHATLGPAAIFYNPENIAVGPYRAHATFIQMRPTRHPEAYGIFVGGRELEGPNQDYLYFLIRQDGKFLVKHRAGSETHTLVGWTAHEAVRRPGDDGKATNTLAVYADEDGVRFLVNDTEVTYLERAPMLNTDGFVGLRVNHRLDVHIDNFGIQRRTVGGEER